MDTVSKNEKLDKVFFLIKLIKSLLKILDKLLMILKVITFF
jgi:hypothetical protein